MKLVESMYIDLGNSSYHKLHIPPQICGQRSDRQHRGLTPTSRAPPARGRGSGPFIPNLPHAAGCSPLPDIFNTLVILLLALI